MEDRGLRLSCTMMPKLFKCLILIGLCQAVCLPAGAQETPPPVSETTVTASATPDPATGAQPATRHFPVEVAGYLGFRYFNRDELEDHSFLREYSASLFLSRTFGRWRIHSEFNAGNSPEDDSEGIRLLHRQRNLSVKLDTLLVNYNLRDWFQTEAGFLFIPTYWRAHRYQSTTLTVDDPLIDQNIFPTAFKGIAIHGDKYFESGGFSYQLYGGVDQQSQFGARDLSRAIERSRSIGGKIVLHLPSRHLLNTLDIGFHRL